MGFDLNPICIVFLVYLGLLFLLPSFTAIWGFFFFFLHGWMSHNGSPKVKMGVELVVVEHGHGQ